MGNFLPCGQIYYPAIPTDLFEMKRVGEDGVG